MSKTTLNIQARLDVRALALCARFYSSKGIYLEKRGTLLRWIVDDLCALIRRSNGWTYNTVEESLEILRACKLIEGKENGEAQKPYLHELQPKALEDIPEGEVEEALKLLREQS